MPFKSSVAIVATSIALAGTTQARGQTPGFTPQDHDLNYLLEIWPGQFDNWQQLEIARGWDQETENTRRQHLIVMPREVGQGRVPELVVVQSNPDNDAEPTRIMFRLAISGDRKSITAQAHRPSEAGERVPKCDLEIRRNAGGFDATVKSDECPDLPREWRITPQDISLYYADSAKLHLRRARMMTCMVDVPPENGNRPTFTQHYIRLHDQGDSFVFRHPDGRDMTVLLGHSWSFGMRRDTMFVAVLDGRGSGPTLAYSWAQPQSDRIGVNPGYVRVQCDLDTQGMRELQEGLRPDS